MPGREEYLRRWSDLHGGADATPWMVRGWLGLAHSVAAPLARRGASPNAVTALALLLAVAVAVPAAAGGRWVLLASTLVLVSAFADNLDGAVAVLTGRTTRWGAVLDAAADRLADTAYVLALYLVGANGPLAVLAGALPALQEYVRARAQAAGMHQVGVVTVFERPTRAIGTAAFLLGAGLYPAEASTWAGVGAAFWAAAGGAALVQVLRAVRRALDDRDPAGPDGATGPGGAAGPGGTA